MALALIGGGGVKFTPGDARVNLWIENVNLSTSRDHRPELILLLCIYYKPDKRRVMAGVF